MIVNDFTDTVAHYRERVTQTLQTAITHATESTSILQEAMLYTTINGGKRLRPTLVYAVGQVFGQSLEQLDNIAAAIECIHAYSLIHDDLPAMDDDSLRRGKPTCHLVFGEAVAILTGDALQTLAFELLSSQKNSLLTVLQHLKLIQLLARDAGSQGMIGGQVLDILAGKNIFLEEIEKVHLLKTGALIKVSVMAGAIAANCEEELTLSKLEQFSEHVGFAFQLQDDLLDMTGVCRIIGKHTQQDRKHNKVTYPVLFGIENTRSKINTLIASAVNILQSLENDTQFLETLCLRLLERDQ